MSVPTVTLEPEQIVMVGEEVIAGLLVTVTDVVAVQPQLSVTVTL